MLILAASVCAGCGSKVTAGKTPRQTVARLESAIKDFDFGAVYDLSSKRVRRQMDRMVDQMQASFKQMPKEFLDEMELDDLQDADTREFFAIMVDRVKEQAPEALDMVANVHFIVMDVDIQGNRALVTLQTLHRGEEQNTELPMVREDGRWYIDSDESIGNLPLNMGTPGVQAAVGDDR